MRRALILLAALTTALYAVLGWYAYCKLRPAADGQLPIDFWGFGYDYSRVQGYLTDLSDTGRAVYLVEMRWLDTAFPLALGVFLALLCWHLSQRLVLWQRALACGLGLAYAVVDLRENALVAALLRAGAEGVDAQMVAAASMMTMLKFALLLSAASVALWLWWRGTT